MSSFRFDFGAADNATDASGAVAPAAAPATAADVDAASAAPQRPTIRIAAVPAAATAAVTRVVEAGGERFDLTVEAESSQVVEAGVY